MIGSRQIGRETIFFLVCSVFLLFMGCTTVHSDLSSLSKPYAPQTVIVSLDTWHAMLAFPLSSETTLQTEVQEFEEWGYAERAWYVEGQTGLGGIFRSLFWPTEGVVEVGHYSKVWAERTPQPPAEMFVFQLEPEHYRQLRQHLESTRTTITPIARLGHSDFYPAVRSYHLFHNCHQYAACALQAAGLPLTPALAFNRTMLGWQLSSLFPSSKDAALATD